MRTNDGFTLRPLGREFIVIAEVRTRVNFNKMVSLNATAAYLWKSLYGKGEFTIDDMARLLCEEYEVDEQTARADSAKLAASWIEAGIASE